MSRIILVLVLLFLLCIITVTILWKALKNEKNKSKQLNAELLKTKENLVFLFKHSVELAEIEKSRIETGQKIEGAKSDEEIIDIINTVIQSNNNRLRNDNQA